MVDREEYISLCKLITKNVFNLFPQYDTNKSEINDIIDKYGIYTPEYCNQYEDDKLYLDEPPNVFISVMSPIFLLIRDKMGGSKSKKKQSRFGDSIPGIESPVKSTKSKKKSGKTIIGNVLGGLIKEETIKSITTQEKKCGESFPDYCQCYLNDLDDESEEANLYRAIYPLVLTLRDIKT